MQHEGYYKCLLVLVSSVLEHTNHWWLFAKWISRDKIDPICESECSKNVSQKTCHTQYPCVFILIIPWILHTNDRSGTDFSGYWCRNVVYLEISRKTIMCNEWFLRINQILFMHLLAMYIQYIAGNMFTDFPWFVLFWLWKFSLFIIPIYSHVFFKIISFAWSKPFVW